MIKPMIIWSEDSRLAADLYVPDQVNGKLPALLLCGGWGGTKASMAKNAEVFVRNGFTCLAFDYRGWGESDGRMIAPANGPMLTAPGEQMVKVRVVRDVIDPFDRILDIANCFAFLLGEGSIDANRVGLWGTSYGGGHCVYFASFEERVKAVVTQVGGYDHPQSDEFKRFARQRAQEKARGVIDPILHGIDAASGLKGTPDIAKQLGYRPIAAAEKVRVPTLVIEAQFEHFGDPKTRGAAVHAAIKKNAPSELMVFPCKHFEIYEDRFRAETLGAAVAWFRKYL